jgi:23S rRNA (cytosine1962-C5)-methyltransferase
MFAADQYQLLDFGAGRKLERFGDYLLDRPSPAAERAAKHHPEMWPEAHASYERIEADRGLWQPADVLSGDWTVRHEPFTLELKPTEFGHIGVFPEQADNWDWIARQVQTASRPLKVLNLFAYTGGSTLTAAAAGAEVVHVDASAAAVAWARRNAERSELAARPIRWLTEDASTFVGREVRRGNRYDAVILDPPSYGHGPKGQVWRLADDLAPLVTACLELTQGEPAFMLLTCHSPGFGHMELATCLSGLDRARLECSALSLVADDGRELASGAVARWSSITL